MRINPNLWFFVALTLVFTQFYIFPISLFYSNYFIAAILYSILPILFCYLGFSRISTFNEIFYPPKSVKSAHVAIKGLVYFFTFIASIIVCFIFIPKKLEKLLLTEGVLEQGLISEVNQINEKFIELTAIVRKNVGNEEYNKEIKLIFRDKKLVQDLPNTIEKGRVVEVLHLEDNFSNVRILCTDKDYKKYRNLKNDYLNVVDLQNFLLIDKSKRIDYLNKKSGFWKFYTGNSFERIYINYIKKEKIVFNQEEKYFTYYKEGEKLTNFEANLNESSPADITSISEKFPEVQLGNTKFYKNMIISEKTGIVALDPNYDEVFGFSCVVFRK